MVVDIVIIGGGISGLTCARELSKYSDSINLTLLEASDRIGGRINSITADDGTILELGAHFIHGTKGNPIYDLVMEKGIIKPESAEVKKPYKIVECYHKDLISSSSQEKINEATRLGNSYIQEMESKMYCLDEKEITRLQTVGNYFMEYFHVKLQEVSHDVELCNALKSVFRYFITSTNFYNGCASLFDLDLQGDIDYEEFGGNLHYILSNYSARGYVDVINAIVDDIEVDCIKLNCEVDKISNVVNDRQSKIKVRCSNGYEICADGAVLTVSVEVLKDFVKNDVFSPQLPAQKISSLDKICLGNVIKIYFKFLTPLENDIAAFEFYPSPETFDVPLTELRENILLFQRVNCTDWWLHWMLCGGKQDLENFDYKEYLCSLVTLCAKKYSIFPIVQVDLSTITTFDWVSNKLYRGSYSYIGKYSDRTEIEKLGEPLSYGKANLFFAGEATCKKYYSTTHGAYMSGIREAENIKNVYMEKVRDEINPPS